MKNQLKAYFTFTGKERAGIILLLFILIGFLLLPSLYPPDLPVVKMDSVFLTEQKMNPSGGLVDDPGQSANFSSADRNKPASAPAASRLFYFDPNEAGEGEWAMLGLHERTIRTIMNYRLKGGRFRQPEDLLKIWGLSAADAKRLIPYVRFKNTQKSTSTDWYSFNAASNQSEKITNLPRRVRQMDINAAKAADWESLPGIGPVLSKRIIRFREKMGGFREMTQLRQTYGISDSLFSSIEPFLTCKVNAALTPVKDSMPDLNKAGLPELIRVGINYEVAKAIITYRKTYGPFAAIEDLRKIIFINEELYKELSIKLVVR